MNHADFLDWYAKNRAYVDSQIKECDACGGDGEIWCEHCETASTCKTCNGRGTTNLPYTQYEKQKSLDGEALETWNETARLL